MSDLGDRSLDLGDLSLLEITKQITLMERSESLSLVKWIKANPVRNGKLLLWMMEKTDSVDQMEDILIALAAAIRMKPTIYDDSVRTALRQALADAKRAGINP